MSGDLNMVGGAELTGDITWRGAPSIIDLAGAERVPAYSITFTAAKVDVHVNKWRSPAPSYVLVGDSVEQGADETFTLTSASLQSIVLHDGAHLTLSAAEADAVVRSTAATLLSARAVAASVDPQDQWRYSRGAYAYSLHADDQIVLDTDSLALDVKGTMVLALWQGDIILAGKEGTRSIRAGEHDEHGGPLPLADDAHVREIVWMVLSGAKLAIEWDAPARVAGAAPVIAVNGVLSTPEATGNLVLDTIAIKARRQSMSVSGDFEITPRLAPEGTPMRTPNDVLVQPYDRFGGGLSGDADDVFVAGARLTLEASTGLSPVAVGAAGIGLLVVVGVLYRYGPVAFAVLYSRIDKGELLTNLIRVQIYDIVRAKPGITGRQIHKGCAAGWGTVVYHLDRLSRGGLLQGVRVGRATQWFTADEARSPTRRSMATQLRGSAGKISRALVSNGPSTPGQLATATGMARSSAYRALSLLTARGLAARIVSDDGPLYHATEDLVDFLGQSALQDPEPAAFRAPGVAEGAPVSLE